MASLLAAGACDQARTTQPPLAHDTGLRKAALSAVAADRQVMRTLAMDAARDGLKNATYWFGDRKHRTPASVCRGMERLFAKHMAKYDAAKGRERSATQRATDAVAIVKGSGCGSRTSMSMFGRPLAIMAPLAVPDSIDDWLAENFHESSWTSALESHAQNDGGSIAPYIGGMTEFEIANFDAVACSQQDVLADLSVVDGESGGEDPMMMFFLPQWAKAALGGCAMNVVVNVPDIVNGARIGFALWGPGGAALAAAAIAAEHCIYGAVAGYIGYKMAT